MDQNPRTSIQKQWAVESAYMCSVCKEYGIPSPQAPPPVQDNVNHPKHYNAGKIEVIEAIEDWKLPYHLGNAVKYIARAGKKNPATEVEDLSKALWYISRQIHLLESRKHGNTSLKPNQTPVPK